MSNRTPPQEKEPGPEWYDEVKRLHSRLDWLDQLLQHSQLLEVMEIYSNPKRRLLSNVIAGISRGLGMTVGTAIILALLGWFLSRFLSVPVIGDYVSDIIDYVQAYR